MVIGSFYTCYMKSGFIKYSTLFYNLPVFPVLFQYKVKL